MNRQLQRYVSPRTVKITTIATLAGSFVAGLAYAYFWQRRRTDGERRHSHKEDLRTWEGEGGALPTGPATTPHVI